MLTDFPGFHWPTPYGVMLALAGLSAWWLARRRAIAFGIDPSHIDLAVPLAFGGGALANLILALAMPADQVLVGATSVAEEFLRMPAVVLALLPALFLYCRTTGVDLPALADAVLPAALLAVGIGYVGCFFAGCCFGDVMGNEIALSSLTDQHLRLQLQTFPTLSQDGFAWAVRFPADSVVYRQQLALGLVAPGSPTTLAVHPVQLYESAAALSLCLVYLGVEARVSRRALLILGASAAYATIAFVLQFFRADSALVLGRLTATQLIYVAWLGSVAALAVAVWPKLTRWDRQTVVEPAGARQPADF
jgi:prolipoprotein diacylglyceryltransferase